MTAVHVTHHAAERFVERVEPCTIEQAKDRILARRRQSTPPHRSGARSCASLAARASSSTAFASSPSTRAATCLTSAAPAISTKGIVSMPSEAIAMHRQRTLANVLLEITAAFRESDANFRQWKNKASIEERDRLSDEGAEIDEKRHALEAEAKTMIERATGVTWDQIYQVLA
jgi:hypothetical protein